LTVLLLQPRSIALLATLAITACAQGQGDDVVADASAGPDARVTIDAHAVIAAQPGRPDANTVDAQPDSPDANTIDAGGGGTGDTCAEAIDITAAASAAGGTTEAGSTAGYTNTLEPPTACTVYGEDGPDVIYYVVASSGDNLAVVMTPTGYDGAVYILSNCDNDSCVAGADSGFDSDAETLSYPIPADGTYYIVVDSFMTDEFGNYTLAVTLD
jgi:hypothetical protein